MADDEYGEDEDDFEDYEDEFEPDEQAEADIQQALQQEAAAVAERLKQANKGPVKTQFLASKPASGPGITPPSLFNPLWHAEFLRAPQSSRAARPARPSPSAPRLHPPHVRSSAASRQLHKGAGR